MSAPTGKRKTDMETAAKMTDAPKVDSTALLAIGEQLRTQDNRCTASPAFCVRVLERIGPIIPEYSSSDMMFQDHQLCETYYRSGPDPDEWKRLNKLYERGELPRSVSAGGYVERWKTVQTCFTEEGCKRYLQQDGHNLRHYYGVEIYVESFHRNLEMLEIRAALMANDQGERPAPSQPSTEERNP